MPKRPVNNCQAYHAHLYFDSATVNQASALADEAGKRFGLRVGRVHRKLVGPHPCWSCQLVFTRSEFEAVIPWLEEKRRGLDIFVHGLSGDDLADHTTHAYWLGNEHVLNLAIFRQ